MESIPDCEQEKLHLSGAIQSFGVLLGGKPGDPTIRFASDNCERYLPSSCSALLGKSLFEVFADLEERLQQQQHTRKILYNLVQRDDLTIDAIYQQSPEAWILELIGECNASPWHQTGFFEYQSTLLANPAQSVDLAEQQRQLVVMISRLSGYQRVMLYQFLPDGSGEVRAEINEGFAENYLGLRFPPSDIPQIARRLYELNPYRSIPDAEQPTSAIVAQQADSQLDLTYSDLRSVSPVHLQYLKNMGVGASLSFSIMVKGELWGLVACHHQQARNLPLTTKESCVSLVQAFATSINAYSVEQQLRYIENADNYANQLDLLLTPSADEVSRQDSALSVMGALQADGLALGLDGEIECFGTTPTNPQIAALVEWTQQHSERIETFHSDALSSDFSPATAYRDLASGVLLLRLNLAHSKSQPRWIAWFRPEQKQVINWAGNPRKLEQADSKGSPMGLMPRNSFALWEEFTEGKSMPWSERDLMMAKRFRVFGMRAVLQDKT